MDLVKKEEVIKKSKEENLIMKKKYKKVLKPLTTKHVDRLNIAILDRLDEKYSRKKTPQHPRNLSDLQKTRFTKTLNDGSYWNKLNLQPKFDSRNPAPQFPTIFENEVGSSSYLTSKSSARY